MCMFFKHRWGSLSLHSLSFCISSSVYLPLFSIRKHSPTGIYWSKFRLLRKYTHTFKTNTMIRVGMQIWACSFFFFSMFDQNRMFIWVCMCVCMYKISKWSKSMSLGQYGCCCFFFLVLCCSKNHACIHQRPKMIIIR